MIILKEVAVGSNLPGGNASESDFSYSVRNFTYLEVKGGILLVIGASGPKLLEAFTSKLGLRAHLLGDFTSRYRPKYT